MLETSRPTFILLLVALNQTSSFMSLNPTVLHSCEQGVHGLDMTIQVNAISYVIGK